MPSPNTDESGMLKVCLQYGSTPFLNYFIYVWRIHFKNIQTILSHAKMRWCVPHARLTLAMLLHHEILRPVESLVNHVESLNQGVSI
jgi:hypothetical protein